MRAGNLREIIELIEPTQTRDARGDLSEQWNVFATVHADIQPITGKQSFEMHHKNYEAEYKIIIRYLSDVSPAMRIRHSGKIYRMTAPPVNSGMRNQTLEIYCTEYLK